MAELNELIDRLNTVRRECWRHRTKVVTRYTPVKVAVRISLRKLFEGKKRTAQTSMADSVTGPTDATNQPSHFYCRAYQKKFGPQTWAS